MLNWSRIKTLARVSLAVVCAPLCLAGSCPSTGAQTGSSSTKLVDGTFTSSNSTAIEFPQISCYTAPAPAHNFLQQNFNASANKLVTCSVTGPTATSRPRIFVTDNFFNVVANSGGTPTSQTTTTTFTPTGTQIFGFFMEDCVPSAAAGNYTVLVTQAN